MRVPAGPAGDAFIDFMCRIWGVTREEALEAGRRAMRTMVRQSPIIPRPLKAPVGRIFFMDNHGNVDEEAVAAAEKHCEEQHTRNCVYVAMRGLDCDHDDIVREVAARHFYPTRYVLGLAGAWIEAALAKHPDLNDDTATDIQWAIDNAMSEAHEDLTKMKEARGESSERTK